MSKTTAIKPHPITSATRVGGLIGKGVRHSLSPFIHNTSASLLGLDVAYLNFQVNESPSLAFFDLMRQADSFGFNITVPFKESVAQILAPGQLVSCNTLINRGDRWDVASTDAEGFVRGLEDIERRLEDFEAVICLGYGGAAKALIDSFQKRVPHTPLFVLKRGDPPASSTSLSFKPFDLSALQETLKLFPKSLLIQCTSAPLRGDDLSAFSPALKDLRGAFVDLVYGHPSALLKEAQDRKIACQDGIPMLLAQALASQKLWWGQSADFSAMKAALLAHLA